MKSQRRSGLRLLKEIQIRLTFPTWHQQWVSCHDALPCNSETRSSNICLHIHIYIPSMTNWYPNPTFPFQFPSPSILPPPLGAIPAGTCNWPKAAAKGFVSTGLLPGPPGATPPPGNGIPGGGPSGIPGSGPPKVIPPKLVYPDRPND
jgi:hypothetical protein